MSRSAGTWSTTGHQSRLKYSPAAGRIFQLPLSSRSRSTGRSVRQVIALHRTFPGHVCPADLSGKSQRHRGLPLLARDALGRGPRREQGAVIAMLRRPEGSTVDEVVNATGWQRHTMRGVFSGTLKKKLGFTIASTNEERGRVYRIAEPASI